MTNLYGAQNAVTVYGVSLFIGACFNFFGYLLAYISQNIFSGSYLISNLITSSLSVVMGIIVTIYTKIWQKRYESSIQ
jgi:hypothetical protein